MRNLSLGLLLTLAATGCKGPGSWEGIWMVQVPLQESDACEPDIDENYKNASVPDEEEIEEGEWVYEDDTKVSDSVFFVQVLEQGGEIFVFVGDEPYYGTAEGGSLTASWTDFIDTESTEEHEQGYEYREVASAETTISLTFTRGEKGVVGGSYDYQTKSTYEWSESDEWEPSDVAFQQGQMNGVAGLYLVNDDAGGTQNGATDDDCDGGDCELVVKTNCKDSVPVQVFFAGDHDEGMFQGIKDANRPYGGAGGGYGDY